MQRKGKLVELSPGFLRALSGMNTPKKYLGYFSSLLLSVFLLTAHAGEGGEGGGKDNKNNLHSRVEVITVNLQGPAKQYVQVDLVLALAKSEVDDRVKKYMPVIRHSLILLLNSKSADQLGSSEGKQKLVLEAREAVNNALGLTDKEGVTDVLFSSFIIQ